MKACAQLALLTCLVAAPVWARPGTARPVRTQRGATKKQCLNHLWDHTMSKHAELVDERRRMLAASPHWYTSDKIAFDPFEPTYTCHSERRVGVLYGDGGKFVCGEQHYFQARSCLVYSVGSAGDARFEADVVKRYGCEVHTFDPTGDTAEYESAVANAGARMHPWGLGVTGTKLRNPITGRDNDLLSVPAILDRLNHANRRIDVFKIDCEGCEYDVFADLWPRIQDGSVTLDQIQVEMHLVDVDRIRAFFESAENAGYMIFHKERNQWGCDGYRCVEYSLIHKSAAHAIFKDTHCLL